MEKELSCWTQGDCKKSWNTYGEVVLADNLEEAVELANAYAPEHLELNVKEPELLQRNCTITAPYL